MNARSAAAKKSVDVVSARFFRKAGGRISKREARALGRLYGVDLHWKYLDASGDKLAARKVGGFAANWADGLAETFKNERRMPRRSAFEATVGRETARHLAFFFWWCGPSGGSWPGERRA